MAEDTHDRSHEATPHRRQEAREKGQVARSQELTSTLLLVVSLAMLFWISGSLVDLLGRYAASHLSGPAWTSVDATFVAEQFRHDLGEFSRVLLPLFGWLFVAAVLFNVFQVGILWVPERAMPDISRIDPIKGFDRIFSLESAVRLLLGLGKVIIIVGVAAFTLWADRDKLLTLSEMSPAGIGLVLLDLLFWTALKIAVAMLVLAAADFFFQRWKLERDLRMTTQELREEMKNLQGDPQIIARRRAVQRQLVLNRLKGTVPKADVVITNPTELAVAIQYEFETMSAPVIIAKGAGVLAQRIRRLALEHGIPVIERKPLAQALYKEVEVNRPIPHKWYSAVADVLAYVYQLQGRKIPAKA